MKKQNITPCLVCYEEKIMKRVILRMFVWVIVAEGDFRWNFFLCPLKRKIKNCGFKRGEGKEKKMQILCVCVCVFFSSLSVWCGVLRRKWRSISSVEWVRNNISVAKLKHRNHIFIGSISRNRKGSRVFIYFSFSRTIKTDIYKNFIKYFLSFSSDKLFYVISTNLPEWNSLTACITKLMRVISSLFA